MAHPIVVTDGDFAELVLNSEVPVAVDFWAPWCPPCRAIAPILHDLAQEYAGKLVIAKLNADENQHTVVHYGVRGLPTLVVFNGGQEIGRLIGARRKSAYQEDFTTMLQAKQLESVG